MRYNESETQPLVTLPVGEKPEPLKMKPSDGVSGKRSGRRPVSEGSSPSRSILWNQLRKLDSQIGLLEMSMPYAQVFPKQWKITKAKIEKLDAMRKGVRLKMKKLPPGEFARKLWVRQSRGEN